MARKNIYLEGNILAGRLGFQTFGSLKVFLLKESLKKKKIKEFEVG